MEAPDTSDIDLDPAHFRCPADLWYRLDQLYTKIGRPSYGKLSKRTGVAPSTLSDLLGANSKTRTNASRPERETVRLFVLGCGMPDTELERWEAAWKASVVQDKPTWPGEQQQLLANIDQLTADLTADKARIEQLATALAAEKSRTGQLTTDFAAAKTYIDQLTTDLATAKKRIEQLAAAVEAAKTRATDAEAALAAYHQAQSAVLRLPEPLEQLRIKAETYYDAHHYMGAADLYGQIAAQVEREYGPGDLRTLQAQHKCLEVETEAHWDACVSRSGYRPPYGQYQPVSFRGSEFERLKACWRQLICAHQQYLPEGDRAILELRLEHICWLANLGEDDRKLLLDLQVDCKLFLPSGDPFTAQISQYVKNGGLRDIRWTSIPPKYGSCVVSVGGFGDAAQPAGPSLPDQRRRTRWSMRWRKRHP